MNNVGSLGLARLAHAGQAMVLGEAPHPGIGSNPEGYVGLSCSDVGAALVTCKKWFTALWRASGEVKLDRHL